MRIYRELANVLLFLLPADSDPAGGSNKEWKPRNLYDNVICWKTGPLHPQTKDRQAMDSDLINLIRFMFVEGFPVSPLSLTEMDIEPAGYLRCVHNFKPI